MFFPGLVSLGWLPPGSNRMDALVLSFTAPVGMIHRVHHHTPDCGPHAKPPFTAGFAQRHVHMIFVANGSDSCITHFKDHPHFPGGKLDCHIVPFLGGNKGPCSGRPGHLCALAQGKFHIVDGKAQRDILQRQGVAWFNGASGPALIVFPTTSPLGAMMYLGGGPRLDRVPHHKPFGQ